MMFQITTQDLEQLYQDHGKARLSPLPQASVGRLYTSLASAQCKVEELES